VFDHKLRRPHVAAVADGVGERGDGGFGQRGELAVGHRHGLVAPAVVDGAEIIVLFQPWADPPVVWRATYAKWAASVIDSPLVSYSCALICVSPSTTRRDADASAEAIDHNNSI
jgi:hypothetical protein